MQPGLPSAQETGGLNPRPVRFDGWTTVPQPDASASEPPSDLTTPNIPSPSIDQMLFPMGQSESSASQWFSRDVPYTPTTSLSFSHAEDQAPMQTVSECMRACMRACVHACMRACVRVSLHVFTRACARVRACVHAWIYVCIRTCVRALGCMFVGICLWGRLKESKIAEGTH